METLKETEKGQLKGGFANAFTLEVQQSSALGNNCKCKNRDSSYDSKVEL